MTGSEFYAVILENISLYYGVHAVLKDINLKVPNGTFVSIVGPNGGGKSTLIKILLGLIKAGSGKATVLDFSPDSIPSGKIGYVPQMKTLDRSFPALPIELVITGLSGTWTAGINPQLKEKALAGLEKVGASHLAYRPLSKLSGGEMQRVYLARSIVRNPELMLLDEPSTGIDSVAEKDISHLLEDYKKETNSTVIMVTHDWEAAYHHSDRVIMLNREIICYAPPAEAFTDENLRLTFGHIGHSHDMSFGGKHG